MANESKKHALETSGKVRDFIAMAMLGVKNGDLPVDKASQIGKLAAQLNDSLYSEAKLATMMTRAGKTPPKLGHLPIGESSVDAAAIKGGQ